MASTDPARQHLAVERCGEISLNTFETRNPDEFSVDCGPNCDAFAQVQRGAIIKAFNVGLKHPQRKELNVDTYNQGCVDPWGCVNSDGYRCAGAVDQKFGPFMQAQFRELNSPYDPSGAEYKPPPYSMGWKSGSQNAVTGWMKLPATNQYVWQSASPKQVACPVAR